MSILVTFMHPRTCANILPAIESLASSGEKVFCFLYYRMSSAASWPKTSPDPRRNLIQRIKSANIEIVSENELKGIELARNFKRVITEKDIRLVITDSNKGKLHWGTPLLYKEARSKKIPVIGCQEGSVDDGEAGIKPIAEGLGINYDYCFCLGKFDEELLLRRNKYLANRLYCVGLPANDLLAKFSNTHQNKKRHVMLVPSWTETAAKNSRFSPMTLDLFAECGIRELSDNFNLPILIKEKTRDQFAFKHLECSKITVTMDETRLDQMIASSACIVGAPSTLLFKGIQLNIPTAVLGKPTMGQLGVFSEFNGLTDSSREQVLGTIKNQMENAGKDTRFLERALIGGVEFDSSLHFVKSVKDILKSSDIYKGKTLWTMGIKKGLAQRFPKQYHALSSFKGLTTG